LLPALLPDDGGRRGDVDETKERAGVDAWLASTGYPVESAAAQALEKAGFEVDLGRLYRDPDTGVRREIDVAARTRLMYDVEPRRVRLVVECKHLEKPWVILTRDREVTSIDVLSWLIASNRARELLVERATEALRRAPHSQTGIPDWLSTPRPHGSAIVAQPRSDRDPESRKGPHDAIAQLEAGALGLVAEHPGALTVSWPILVVRGSLYQAKLGDAGELKAEPVEWQRVVWGGVTGQPIIVDVVRERHLAAYARTAHNGLASLESALHAATE
jgi:hypothetical protein